MGKATLNSPSPNLTKTCPYYELLKNPEKYNMFVLMKDILGILIFYSFGVLKQIVAYKH